MDVLQVPSDAGDSQALRLGRNQRVTMGHLMAADFHLFVRYSSRNGTFSLSRKLDLEMEGGLHYVTKSKE